MHTIGWFVTDSCGRSDGIGSRFFAVANASSIATAAPIASVAMPREWGLTRNGTAASLAIAADGTRVVRLDQTDRIEVQLPNGSYRAGTLPIGSSFDAASNTFMWQPGPGFLGAYDLPFTAGTRVEKLRVVVGPSIRLMIDTPHAGNVLNASAFTIAGWAVDLASLDGAGIDALHVWATPVGGRSTGSGQGAPRFVGVAKAGGARPDVANLYGPSFANPGFTLDGTLPPGTYDVTVFAHSAATNTFEGAQTVRVIVR